MHAQRISGRYAGPDDSLILRKARKQHECGGDGSASHRHAADCLHVIEPGEHYVENTNESPAYQSGSPMTLACCREWWQIEFDVQGPEA